MRRTHLLVPTLAEGAAEASPDCPDLIPEVGVLMVDELWVHLGTGTSE